MNSEPPVAPPNNLMCVLPFGSVKSTQPSVASSSGSFAVGTATAASPLAMLQLAPDPTTFTENERVPPGAARSCTALFDPVENVVLTVEPGAPGAKRWEMSGITDLRSSVGACASGPCGTAGPLRAA